MVRGNVYIFPFSKKAIASQVWCANENPRPRRLARNRRPLCQVSAREGPLGDRVLAHAREARRHAPRADEGRGRLP